VLNLTLKRWFRDIFGFVTIEELNNKIFGPNQHITLKDQEFIEKKARIATLNHVDNHLQHIKLHLKVLNEQKQTRKARRVSKGTNKALKKRAKKSTSNNKRLGKRTRILAK